MASSESTRVPSTLSGLSALVVDDSMLIRHTVCRFLEERGFRVETATNGVEALEALAGFIPDIIVTDLSMPQMTGGELITEIKTRPVLTDTPIIVLSARPKANTTPQEIRATFVVYKDIDIEEQLDIVLIKVFSK